MSSWASFAASTGSNVAMGFAAGGPIGALGAGIESGITGALSLLGRGRQEADIISPIQNTIGNLLIEANRQMGDPSTTVEELRGLYGTIVDAYTNFDRFTRDLRFTDGRASVQARNTIRPLVDGKDDRGVQIRTDGGTLGNLQRRINERSGIVDAIGSAVGGNNSGLLLAGAVVAAKLFKFF